MAIKSKSDLFRFRVYIFDLDNTMYNEADYLFQGYAAISRFLADISDDISETEIFCELKSRFLCEGRTGLFDKVLLKFKFDANLVKECVRILHSFSVEKKLILHNDVKILLERLIKPEKQIFILTNGNRTQQENKINSIDWGKLRNHIRIIYASDIEPKPSPAGVKKILTLAESSEAEAVFIGDSDTDRMCAMYSGIEYFDVAGLSGKTSL
ncbi:MAG: HAD hydrolase-like protein [Bacteroidales bacterium]|jgi:FMN phosphatase YigB (HAD superfamily)|nr:HAD hydrolase-like protein [Bacteroidales bacterium]